MVVGKDGATPKPGDLSVCMRCGAWHRFTDTEGTLRPFTVEDWVELPDALLNELRRATKAVQEAGREFARKGGKWGDA
jgi:hypothetical protein